MKISAIQSNYTTNVYATQRGKTNKVQQTNATQKMQPSAIISFEGKNKNHVVFIGAELPPYCKVGGVGTVMKDYTTFPCEKKAMIIPYYNGKIEYDEQGKATEEVSVHRFPKTHELAGQPFYTKADLSTTTIDKVLETKDYVVLEEVGKEQNMAWGIKDENKIQMFHVKDTGTTDEKGETKPDVYMVFTDVTARMPKPYGDDSYTSNFGGNDSSHWEGSAYAKFDRAVVELMPLMQEKQKDFEAGTVICSDSQTAYVPLYMALKNKEGAEYYQNMKSSFVGHNLGHGTYCSTTTNKNMLVNIGLTKEQIELIKEDPEYINAVEHDKFQEEKYLKKFLASEIFDDTGAANPILIPLILKQQGLVSAVTTVSEGYSDKLASSPILSPIHTVWEKMAKDNQVGGILNPLNATDVTGFKPMSNKWLNTAYDIKLKDGNTASIKPFAIFDEAKIKAGDIEHLKEIKIQNKINLIERLNLHDQIEEGEYKAPDGKTITAKELENGLMSGNTKNVGIFGKIDDSYLEKLKKGEDVTVFVTWGRGDFQKGLDTTIQAFEAYIQNTGDENALLLLGGEIPTEGDEKLRLEEEIRKITNGSLKGKAVYMDGYVPANGFASAADAAVFPSRFAPCELTDLESKKFFATPIVTNCQGLAQKNFDRSFKDEADKVDAFKTKHEFYMIEKEIEECGHQKIVDDYKVEMDKLITKERTKIQSHNSVSEKKVQGDKIEDLAIENARNTKEYEKLMRETRDKIIKEELAGKFAEYVDAKNNDKDLMKKILINQANQDTTWSGNAASHPSGKSTAQLYKEQHIDPEAKNVKDIANIALFTGFAATIAESFKKIKENRKVMIGSNGVNIDTKEISNSINEIKEAIKEGNEKIVEAIKNGGEAAKKSGVGKYIGISAAVIAGAVGTGLYLKNQKDKAENEIQGETFVING